MHLARTYDETPIIPTFTDPTQSALDHVLYISNTLSDWCVHASLELRLKLERLCRFIMLFAQNSTHGTDKTLRDVVEPNNNDIDPDNNHINTTQTSDTNHD